MRAAEGEEQHPHPGDVRERDRERDPPRADAVEDGVERHVEDEVRERDHGRNPRLLQAEEAAVQHQHHPVEGEADREGGEGAGDDVRLAGQERAALVEQADDRLGQDDRERGRGQQEEVDLAQAERDRVPHPGQVAPGREPGEGREEDGRDRDREHPLREHVDPKGLVDRVRGDERVDPLRRHDRADDSIDVDQAEAEGHRHHQQEHLLDGRIANVEREAETSVEPAQPRQRQQELDHGPDQDRAGVDVELPRLGVCPRDAEDRARR